MGDSLRAGETAIVRNDMKRRPALGVPRMRSLVLLLVLAAPAYADDATITDASGKEIVLKKWSFTTGVVKPAWLGKDALAFRESNSTTFRDGVMTFIPLERLESLT